MKKCLSFLMAIVLVSTVVSCESENSNDASLKDVSQMVEKKLWEHQLDYAMEHNAVVDYPLKMLGYKYLQIISSEVDVTKYLNFIYSNDSYLAINSSRTDDNFEVFSRQELIDGCAEQGLDAVEQFKKHREQVSNYITIGSTHIVEIYWNYKGKDFITWALVDEGDKGVIYDNVASVARCPRPDADVTWKRFVKPNPPQKINRTRSDNEVQGRILRATFYLTDHHVDKNYLGRYLWEYEIKCVSKFDEQTGVYLGTEEMYANSSHQDLWGCDAEIMTVYGVAMSTSSHTFKWAYSYGVGTISITILGMGFSFSGAGENRTGEECHSIDNCPTA